jgi:hypothetical protein
MISITKYPTRNIEGSPSKPSKWVAAHNPIIYEMVRQDYIVTSIQQSVNDGEIIVNLASPITSPDTVAANDVIYIKAGVYDKIVTVKSVPSATKITLLHEFLGTGTGYINLSIRENYHLDIEVLAVENNKYYVLGSLSATPDIKGNLKINIQEWVRQLAGYENDYNYTSLNKKDRKLSDTFNIRFVEVWEDNLGNDLSTAPITPSGRMFFGNAAMQIGDTYGQNLGDFVPVPSGSPAALFLSGFESPTKFRGYPFDLQFIYSDNISGFQVERNVEEYDINGTNLSVGYSGILANTEAKFINRVKINEPDADAKTIQAWIQIDNSVTAVSTYATNHTTNYWQQINLSLSEPESPTT